MSRFIPARNVFTKNAAILSNHYLTHQLEGDRRSPLRNTLRRPGLTSYRLPDNPIL
jgi:hypothetical protein